MPFTKEDVKLVLEALENYYVKLTQTMWNYDNNENFNHFSTEYTNVMKSIRNKIDNVDKLIQYYENLPKL